MEGFAGVTAMDTKVAAVTLRVVLPEMAPEVALIVVVPTPAPDAKPAAVMVATAGVEEFHVTLAVRFCVLLSEKTPVAENCCVAPLATAALAGVTKMDCKVAAVTVSVVLPLIIPEVAVMLEEPTLAPVAKPVVLIVATALDADAQATLPVKFCVLLSLNVPVAVNC